jgi:hypothetical protein
LNVQVLGAVVALQNVVFKDILGGALLLDCGGTSSTPSTPPTSPTTPTTPTTPTSPSTGAPLIPASGIVVQVQLSGVVFLNIAVKPALTVLGNVQVQLINCQFENNGLASLNNTGASNENNNGNVIGASILAYGNVLGLKVTLTLRACVFLNNLGASIIHLGGPLCGDELIFIDVNTFIGNIAATAIIDANVNLSLLTCLGCNLIWTNNVTPLLCSVSCGLLGIPLLCPGSCPGILGGILGVL